jgi:holo-[acyl-carrier protein] synthase
VIIGIGTDLVRVARLEEGLARFGEAFARRILGEAEWAEFGRESRPAAFLAKRFAAKEAAAKALGTGFRGGMRLCDIVVIHEEAGRPGLRYGGIAAQRVREMGVSASHLSLSDERDYALAFVVLVGG